jgi:hypothetical protein
MNPNSSNLKSDGAETDRTRQAESQTASIAGQSKSVALRGMDLL